MNKRLKSASEAMTLIFAIVVLCVMLAAGGELGWQFLGLHKAIGTGILAVFCTVMTLIRPESSMRLGAVLGGIIVFGCIICTLYLLRYREHQAFMNNAKIMISGASYTGYNLLTAGAILVPMSGTLKSKADARLTGIISGFAMLIMLFLMWGLLIIYYGHINLGEMPMITMALRESRPLAAVYAAIMLLAVLTTAASNGIGAVNIISEKTDCRLPAALTVTAVCYCMSGAGFSALINILYRGCGYIGFILVIYIFFRHFSVKYFSNKYLKNEEKQRI